MAAGDHADALVVGAGVFGASVADALAGRGWTVRLVDQYNPGHPRAASGDESRLIRYGHGPDRWYTRWAWAARARWLELAAELGEDLLVECGMAWFAYDEAGWEVRCEQTLRAERIPVERLAPADAAQLFPSVNTDDLACVVFEPAAGVLHARRAVQALVRRATRRGAALLAGRAVPAGSDVTVEGRAVGADRVVWACGAWLPALFPEVDVRVTKQDVLYFGVPPSWTSPPVPGWVDYREAIYGHGDVDARGFKCAPDVEGPPFDPEADERTASQENIDRGRAYLRRRFPALAGAPLTGTRTCQYSLTADTNFVIAPLDETARDWVVGGGSGHGFKHGPALGDYVADLLEGQPADERFALGPRGEGTGMRTSGGGGGAQASS